MARGNQLTAKEVASVAGKRSRGLLCDGAGLWLQTTYGGASWLYKYTAAAAIPHSGSGHLVRASLRAASARHGHSRSADCVSITLAKRLR